MDVHFLGTGVSALHGIGADALIVVLCGDTRPKQLDAACARVVDDAVRLGDLAFKPGAKLYVHRPDAMAVPRLVLCVVSPAEPKTIKAAFASAAAMLPNDLKHLAVVLAGAALDTVNAQAIVTSALEASYLYRHTKPSAPQAPAWARLTLVGEKGDAQRAQAGIDTGCAVARGINTARELANRPGNHCTPSYLGQEAKRIGKRYAIDVEVHDRKSIERIGMGSFLAVAKGSDEPPCFIVMHYRGDRAKGAATHVIVGKGITFDSGGISIKSAAEMDEMKFDMGGAASVLGTMTALGELKPRVNVVGLVPTCENLPSGRAIKPGDVITSLSGKTIEVLNTDAEGRLILCDALTYAERFKPASVVDIATLTGACVIALGHHHSGLFSPDDKLATDLLAASRAALDPAWRMPLDAEYDEGLKSSFADVPNIGGRAGGAITAAKFLQRFTDGKYPWAHLDVAGTAWKSGSAKGATGRPVALLTHYLLSRVGVGVSGGASGGAARKAGGVASARTPRAGKAKAGSAKARG